jgi:hypothetical protein
MRTTKRSESKGQLLLQLDARFISSEPSLCRLNHAYQAMASVIRTTNAVVTSFVVGAEKPRGSQSAAAPWGGICWFR